MKIIEVAFAMLIFNICIGLTSHAMIVQYPIYYESSYVNTFQPGTGSLPGNISTVSEEQQYGTTMDVVNVVLSVTDFGWLYALIPDELDDDFAIYIGSIQAIVGFLYAIAIIELFVRREEILGSSGGGG
jgi:hypothetical protein